MVRLGVLDCLVAERSRDPGWHPHNPAGSDQADPQHRRGAGAVLPCAEMDLVAYIALLPWRHWGVVLAILALSLIPRKTLISDQSYPRHFAGSIPSLIGDQ